MSDDEYLESVLAAQDLSAESLQRLEKHRSAVTDLLFAAFPDPRPTVRQAGSIAKETANEETHDLDLTCYFAHDDKQAGETLEEIYESVADALRQHYVVRRKTSAIRLYSRDEEDDLHVDVVPGRFIEGSDGDVFLHHRGDDRERLRTNLDVHIEHIRESGVRPAIRLMKLWNFRRGVEVKTFVLELLVVKLLEDRLDEPLSKQLRYVLEQLRDEVDSIEVEDPANPTGNDLSDRWSPEIRARVSVAAKETLEVVDESGWPDVFGASADEADRAAALERAAAAVPPQARYQPWRESS